MNKEINSAQICVAEEIVLSQMPKDMREWLQQANKDFAAKGGCPDCGSRLVSVHASGCASLRRGNE